VYQYHHFLYEKVIIDYEELDEVKMVLSSSYSIIIIDQSNLQILMDF
jgi:hypothetical protein